MTTTPDTITQFNARTFCIGNSGFGLSSEVSLTVFKPFFVDLVLPYSVIQGETLTLKALVFNYLPQCIKVQVTLLQSLFTIQNCFNCQYTKCICADESVSFNWKITANKIGFLPLTVRAEAVDSTVTCGSKAVYVPPNGNLDILQKQLLVKPQGIKKEITQNTFLCLKGYQRELTYKHLDGSYSAFGENDGEGSTWLTTFVIKCFYQAKKYVFIDEKVLQQAVQWLTTSQNPNGCFKSRGKLFHTLMKGGVEDDLSLSAYITAALLEIGSLKEDINLASALSCLRANVTGSTNAYTLALLAYTFTLANDIKTRQVLLDRLYSLAASSEMDLYWPYTLRSSESNGLVSASIELSAYVLLALVSSPTLNPNELTNASRIVSWLSKQQNPYGGFSSTQVKMLNCRQLSYLVSFSLLGSCLEIQESNFCNFTSFGTHLEPQC
ncbi:alpha-2-macroglobulin-like protein 1 [Pyxicephalus adspersus]|uniref:alpha-2-macroglobulin-like protein 1 n=1 Tax=Pyxicephalus adspersus TaxID=30357 RepID=UPI003B5CCB9A